MYPLLSKLPKPPATLTDQFRTILLAVGHVADGNASACAAAFRYIAPEEVPKAYELCIVQSAPLIGIPRVLHSAAALQEAGIVGEKSSSPADSLADLHTKGTETFSKIYGRNNTRVRTRLSDLSEDLEKWIVSHVYGAIFSKQGISLRERELAIVTTLCADKCAGVQLASHLRGAINVGASRAEVENVVAMSEVLYGLEQGERVKAVWESYERARYAL